MRTHPSAPRRFGAAVLALSFAAVFVLFSGGHANAAIVPTVPLGTAAEYNVLGGATVTNTGTSTIPLSVGVHPGTATPGILDGDVGPPGVVHRGDAAALQAQSDLTAAYNNAAGRSADFTETVDLGNKTLGAGVYVSDLGPLAITGPLVLDAAGNRNSVFIFKASSTLITASNSTVSLINGAQECNVFWQVGSSATLGTDSVFRGNILALTSITVNTNVTVHGRALARNGATTLDSDVFAAPSCQLTGAVPGFPTPTPGDEGPGTTPTADNPTGTGTGTGTGSPGDGTATGLTNGVPPVSGPPRTGGAPLQGDGGFPWLAVLFAGLVVGAGTTDMILSRRARARLAEVGTSDPSKPE